MLEQSNQCAPPPWYQTSTGKVLVASSLEGMIHLTGKLPPSTAMFLSSTEYVESVRIYQLLNVLVLSSTDQQVASRYDTGEMARGQLGQIHETPPSRTCLEEALEVPVCPGAISRKLQRTRGSYSREVVVNLKVGGDRGDWYTRAHRSARNMYPVARRRVCADRRPGKVGRG